MITDAQTKFSDAQAVTTGTQVSTNAYDMGVARDIGRGRDLRIYATATTAFTGGTSLQVNVIESANSDLSSASVISSGAVVAEAALTAGKVLLDIALPQTSKRYVGLQYVSVGTHTAGAVTGGIVLNTDSNTTFPAVTGF
jgi:hypothetical protein